MNRDSTDKMMETTGKKNGRKKSLFDGAPPIGRRRWFYACDGHVPRAGRVIYRSCASAVDGVIESADVKPHRPHGQVYWNTRYNLCAPSPDYIIIIIVLRGHFARVGGAPRQWRRLSYL